ncbi:hypothetical protein KKD03_02975 [Patescibacteria group bacterium]|nr:hypothetical protein [Patescibacteria group bacterium]
MTIDFSKLNFTFSKKPLIIGGMAMEHYGLRKSGADIDLVACKEDIEKLVKKYPQNLKNLWGDFGIAIYDFEIWKTVRYFDYDYLKEDAIERENYLIISLDKLLLQKAVAMEEEKYLNDLKLIVKKIQSNQSEKSEQIKSENQSILSKVDNVEYVEYVEKIGEN